MLVEILYFVDRQPVLKLGSADIDLPHHKPVWPEWPPYGYYTDKDGHPSINWYMCTIENNQYANINNRIPVKTGDHLIRGVGCEVLMNKKIDSSSADSVIEWASLRLPKAKFTVK